METGVLYFKSIPDLRGCRYLFCVVALHVMSPAFADKLYIAEGETETWTEDIFADPPQAVTLGKNATLEFKFQHKARQPDSVTFGGTIAGDGKVRQSGPGNVTLGGGNTYTGGTTVMGGTGDGDKESTLRGTGNSFGSGSIHLNGRYDYLVVSGQYHQLKNKITGAGGLRRDGAGLFSLDGKNTYTGGTTMIRGSLKGTVDSFGSDDIYMNSNTSLIIAQNGDGILNNTISGKGALLKFETGIVTLAAKNDYEVGTLITGGSGPNKMSFLAGTVDSFGSGDITVRNEYDSLIIAQDEDGTLNNTISGEGNLVKDGTGNVTLGSQNDYKGDTYIYSGSLTGTTESFGTEGSIYFNHDAERPQYIDPDPSDDTALIIDQDFDGQWNHYFFDSTDRPNASKVIKRGSGTVTITTEEYDDYDPEETYDPSLDPSLLTLVPYSPGEFRVEEGILRAGGINTLGVRDPFFNGDGADYHVGASGTVDLNGFDHYLVAIDNAGTVTLSPQGQAGTKLTVKKYVGRGGTLVLNTVLGDEKTESDKLVVDEDVSGHTTMVVHDAGGLGAQTTGDGIAVVEVGGKSDEDAFSLAGGHIDAGAYEYHLYKGGLAAGDSRKNDSDAEDSDEKNRDESWYLRSSTIKTLQAGTSGTVAPVTVATAGSLPPVSSGTNVSEPVPTYRRELPLYAGLPAQLRQADLAMLGNLHERIGQTPVAPGCLGWGRFIAGNAEIKQRGLARASSSGAFSGIQLGSDLICRNDWRVGAYGGYLRGDREVRGFAGGSFGKVGDAKIDSYFLAAYGTYTRANGSYLDLVLQAARHDADLRPKGNPGGAQHGNSITLSAQAGLPLALGSSNWTLEPQAQLVNQYLDISDTHISGKTTLRQGHDNAFLFRFGADLKNDIKLGRGLFQPYGRVNLYYSPSGADQLTVATLSTSQTFSSGARYTSTELALGATLEVAKKLKVYGQLGHIWSHGGAAKVRSDVQGSIGIRASF